MEVIFLCIDSDANFFFSILVLFHSYLRLNTIFLKEVTLVETFVGFKTMNSLMFFIKNLLGGSYIFVQWQTAYRFQHAKRNIFNL